MRFGSGEDEDGVCGRLFERFYTVDKARSRRLGGTGLGLAIVKHITLAHDGRVSLSSTPGKGSAFQIRQWWHVEHLHRVGFTVGGRVREAIPIHANAIAHINVTPGPDLHIQLEDLRRTRVDQHHPVVDPLAEQFLDQVEPVGPVLEGLVDALDDTKPQVRRIALQALQRPIVLHQVELAAPAPLNLVCFRHRGGDAVNQAILDRLNASGELFLTHTKLDGKLVLRMSIGQTHTERRHVEAAWEAGIRPRVVGNYFPWHRLPVPPGCLRPTPWVPYRS